MGKIINQENINSEEIINNIKHGKIFIYPTDTIYGLGCDATNKNAVAKLKEIKKREKHKPLSIIAPSIHWIKENCIIPKSLHIGKYLPGPYTLILKKKDSDFLHHVSNTDSLGIRIPNNQLTKIIQQSRMPFITTSVNISGEPPTINIETINQGIKDKVDIIIKSNKTLSGTPSTLIVNDKEIKR